MGNPSLTTESINQETANIDNLSTKKILTTFNKEDNKITDAVLQVIPQITNVVDTVFQVIQKGGNVFFIGAGTSGRLGVLEAAECPPTFGVSDQQFQAVIAGGEKAVFKSVESAEDDEDQGIRDLQNKGFTSKDIVIGIAASGKTPYVIGALQWAKTQNAKTVAVACNHASVIGDIADQKIEVDVGPEAVSGSTRMKAGSATKMILNMITTASMIKMGKVYRNLMVDLNISNNKLKERAINMIKIAAHTNEETAEEALRVSNNDVKLAIVMINKGIDIDEARKRLAEANGYVRLAIDEITPKL